MYTVFLPYSQKYLNNRLRRFMQLLLVWIDFVLFDIGMIVVDITQHCFEYSPEMRTLVFILIGSGVFFSRRNRIQYIRLKPSKPKISLNLNLNLNSDPQLLYFHFLAKKYLLFEHFVLSTACFCRTHLYSDIPRYLP